MLFRLTSFASGGQKQNTKGSGPEVLPLEEDGTSFYYIATNSRQNTTILTASVVSMSDQT